jgi:glycosyltransferase involved in cell wall biosynthesis
MYKNKTISVVLPTYNEETSIKDCINNFFSTGVVDEILVVDNNSIDNTAGEIKKTAAKYIFEKQQGYGIALRTGIQNCTSDYIITCEPDGTFDAFDIFKFLLYSEKFDCVFGTRTSKSMIGPGAKMTFYLRYGNIIVAKMLEYFFNGPTLTDVGCTYKLISRKNYIQIHNKLKVNGSQFQPELMIHLISTKCSIVEIPINYLYRKGVSKITYNFIRSLILAIKMVYLITFTRIKFFIKK